MLSELNYFKLKLGSHIFLSWVVLCLYLLVVSTLLHVNLPSVDGSWSGYIG